MRVHPPNLLTAALLAWPVSAQTPAAVLGLEAKGVPPGIAQQMTLALRLGLADAPGLLAVPGKELFEMRMVFCSGEENPECLARAARSLGADLVLFGSVAPTDEGFTVAVKLLDAPAAAIKSTAAETLPPVPAPQDFEAASTRLLARLTGTAASGSLRVLCEPSGARLSIDGTDVGYVGEGGRTVPEVAAGGRTIRLTLEGYRPFEKVVEVNSGAPGELRVQLVPEGVPSPLITAGLPPPPARGHARAWRIASWVSLGVAVAAGTAAVVTGLKTRSLEDDKNDKVAVSRFRAAPADPAYISAGPDDDACAEADREGNMDVSELCDRGRRMATITNVLLGTAGAAALMWGVSFHMGYLRVEAEPGRTVVLAESRF